MSLQFNSGLARKKNPVKRNNKFFSGEDTRLQLGYMKEYIEENASQTVVLYQVDLEKTKVNDTYLEAKKDNIRFKAPVEIPVIYELQESELQSYNDNNKGVFAKTGKLVFSVLLSTLEEYNCDIFRGDYIGVQVTTEHMEYFSVTNDGRVAATANKFTMFGTEPFARTIECAPIDLGEFNG